MFNKDSLIAQATPGGKNEIQLCLKCQIALRRASVEETLSGLMWSYSKGSAVCCCLLLHPPPNTHRDTHTTAIHPNTPIFTQQTCRYSLKMIIILGEQEANAEQ